MRKEAGTLGVKAGEEGQREREEAGREREKPRRCPSVWSPYLKQVQPYMEPYAALKKYVVDLQLSAWRDAHRILPGKEGCLQHSVCNNSPR